MRGFFAHRIAAVVALIILLAFLLVAIVAAAVSRETSHRRHDICIQVQDVKGILYNEHKTKLVRAREFLRTHPNGIDGIDRLVILRSIADEKTIIRETKPIRCPE